MKRHFFQPDEHAMLQSLGRPVNLVEMDVAFFLIQDFRFVAMNYYE